MARTWRNLATGGSGALKRAARIGSTEETETDRTVRDSAGPVRASDLAQELNNDPSYVAETRRRDQSLEAREAELRAAQAPLLTDLHAVGMSVRDVWLIDKTSAAYAAAIPILLEALSQAYPDRVRDGVARALSAAPAAPYWADLRRLYEREPLETETKDGLAATLSHIATSETFFELVELVKNPVHGSSRVLLVGGLPRFRRPEARATVDALADDPVLAQQVALIQKRRRDRT